MIYQVCDLDKNRWLCSSILGSLSLENNTELKDLPSVTEHYFRRETFLFIIDYKAGEVAKHRVGIEFYIALCERVDQ